MAKIATMVTIDDDLKLHAKALQINISAALNDYLEVLVNRHNQDIGGINIKLERSKLAKLQKQQGELQAKINECLASIQLCEEKQAEAEERKLKKEKDKIEKQSKCMNCGNFIEFKIHNFNNGKVCHVCFMSATGEQIAKWNEKD